MSTSEEARCQRCGAAVATSSLEALCPACLMSAAMNPAEGAATEARGADQVAPAPFEPQEFPCAFGGYRLLGLLGRGGMGTVYEAVELSTGRRVALKMLGRQLDSPEMRQRFLREGRLAAGVNHPNSLYIFGSEEIEGLPVITMEIAGSGTLQDRLNRQGPFPVSEAVDAVLDIVSGLESASLKGVLHRDIKPSNCFVSPDGSVKVGDFGLSVSTLTKSDSVVTTLGRIMGTPAYASPEQLRGDTLDLRADIYSVGATLFTLLTNRVPFEGNNAVQVVANAVNKKAPPVSSYRTGVPPGLERVIARCLAKEPEGRYGDYTELRNALLPFSSREPEPASMKARAQAGWIDYLTAFLVPYIVLMLAVGNETFHFQLFMERTLYSARYYITFLSLGLLYFSVVEGLWGAGLGKRLKGLRVIRKDGRSPGIGRAMIRFLLPLLSVEGVRVPFLLMTISATSIDGLSVADAVAYSAATFFCPWIPVLLGMTARQKNGFATFWDLASGTRVIVKPEETPRPLPEQVPHLEPDAGGGSGFGPYVMIEEIQPGSWILAADPVLHRTVWLRKRGNAGVSVSRKEVARPGRPRWLQNVEVKGETWDAYEALPGHPFSELVEDGKGVGWLTLRHWLHDLAAELWSATSDGTLPTALSLDHVWITDQGNALLLDDSWPRVEHPAERFPVVDLDGQQRFLNEVALHVDSTSVPLHARPVLQNLEGRKFDKLSFLTGILRGLLDKPAELSRGIRAGAIFMVPLYVWVMFFIGSYTGGRAQEWYGSLGWILLTPTLVVLAGAALVQLLEIPFRTTIGHTIFRLAVINSKGVRAGRTTLLLRWAISWLPLILALSIITLLAGASHPAAAAAGGIGVILLWLGAALYAVLNPNQGLHDRWAGTWVVRY